MPFNYRGDTMNKVIGLIAGTSGDSLTNQFQRLGYKVALVIGKHTEPGHNIADYVLVTDLDNGDDIISFFNKVEANFVIFGTGHYKAINLLPLLERHGFVTNLSVEKFNLVKDKIKFKDYIVKKGFLTPSYSKVETFVDFQLYKPTFKFPSVVKSAIDVVQPIKVYDITRLEEVVVNILEKNSAVLIEEYIDGSDCTVAVTNVNREISNYGVLYYCKAKEYNLEGFTNANSSKLNKSLELLICNISEHLVFNVNVPGLVRVDYIVKDNIPYILEINAVIVTGYTGSAYPFFTDANIDISKIMAETALAICLNKMPA